MQKTKIKGALITLAFPLLIWLLMEVLCLAVMGEHVIGSTLDFNNYIRSVGISACIALALSFNLGSGRFDLSLGGQRMVATIVGGNIALAMGWGSVGVILCALASGLLFGTLVGFVFVTFRVPPMVLGIGMALIYECVAFASSDANGLQLFGKGCDSLSDMTVTIAVVAVATLFVGILFQYAVGVFPDNLLSDDFSEVAMGHHPEVYLALMEYYDYQDENDYSMRPVTNTETSNWLDTLMPDVARGSYYNSAVTWAVSNGVTTGTTATTFSPDRACTRAEVVTFLWRAYGSPMVEDDGVPFRDVSSDAF